MGTLSMMPGHQLSTQLEFGDFLTPDNLPCSPTLSYQLGGISVSDPSKGLQVQTWMAQLVNPALSTSYVTLSAPTYPTQTLYTLSYISQISLAFDQNMKPCLAYMQQGLSYLWWYDATIPGYTVVPLPSGSYSPQVTLDDKRLVSVQQSFTDIVLIYLRNANMYMRQERDRFTTEYVLLQGIEYYNPQLYKIGMCSSDRLLIQVNADLYG